MTKTRRLLLLGIMAGTLMGSCIAMNPRKEDDIFYKEEKPEIFEELSMDELNRRICELLNPRDMDTFEYTDEMSNQMDDFSDRYTSGILGKIEEISRLVSNVQLPRSGESGETDLLLKKIGLLEAKIKELEQTILRQQDDLRDKNQKIEKLKKVGETFIQCKKECDRLQNVEHVLGKEIAESKEETNKWQKMSDVLLGRCKRLQGDKKMLSQRVDQLFELVNKKFLQQEEG